MIRTMQHPSEQRAVRQGKLPSKIREFMEMESAGGIVMLCSAVAALICANSSLSELYQHIIHYLLNFSFSTLSISIPLSHGVNDALMVLFFFVVGLELNREMNEGFLTQKDQIILPLVAAAAGMLFPALIFYIFNHNSPDTIHGWAVPSATDIAFAVAILNLIGKMIPPSLKIFLLAVAIFDDIGAIIIIALFYNAGLALIPSLCAITFTAMLFLLRSYRIPAITPYLFIGTALAISLFYCGIHTTLAGVITGLAIPMRDASNQRYSPVNRCIHALHPWVSFMIVPLFAFCASGVDLRGITIDMLTSPLPLGIMFGLFIGKQLGIFSSVWLLVTSGKIAMPHAATWSHIYLVAILTGIGFTMSLFIGLLAFTSPQLVDDVKLGVVSGTSLSILWAMLMSQILRKRMHSRNA
jgi:NhaA family Na+:H+ antiporter